MEINAQHELFIEALLECGNHYEAAEAAGFSRAYGATLIRKLKDEINKRLGDEMTAMQVQAVFVMRDTLGKGAVNPKQDLRMKAAQDVMDRGGLIKKQQLDVKGMEMPAVMVLPPKEPVPETQRVDEHEEE